MARTVLRYSFVPNNVNINDYIVALREGSLHLCLNTELDIKETSVQCFNDHLAAQKNIIGTYCFLCYKNVEWLNPQERSFNT